MRFAILGAGALGSVYGAHLTRAGHDVILVARGQHYQALRGKGLRLVASGEEFTCQPKVVDNARRVGQCDVAIVTVKARDTLPLLGDAAHLAKNGSVFISFQNSGDKDELMARIVGERNVVGGVSTVGATLVAPGVVEHTSLGCTWLGELPAGTSGRVEKIAEAFHTSKLETEVAKDITSVKWTKLVQFCASAGVSALTKLYWHRVFQRPELARIVVDMVKEGVVAMRSLGVAVADYPKLLPIRTISELPTHETVELLVKRGGEMERRGYTKVVVSMLQDVHREKPLEVDETVGFLLEKAAQAGVQMPTTRTVHALVKGLESSYLKNA